MSSDWFSDIGHMHDFYDMTKKHAELPAAHLLKLLSFRSAFIKEELTELYEGMELLDPEKVVDALIDQVVVIIGTLHAFGVDGQKAWDAVLKANMTKQAGVNLTRPNELGLPDLIKPRGWTPPSHDGNYGLLNKAFSAYGADVYSPCEV